MKKEIAFTVSFQNKEEFMEAWRVSQQYAIKLLQREGIFLNIKGNKDAIVYVECVTDKGLLFEGHITVTNWEEVLNGYEFLDGTECGRKIKIVNKSKRCRPFQSPQEFLQFYHFTCGKFPYGSFESTLCRSGIWLKTENNIFENVVELGDDGLRIAHSDGVVTWERLCNRDTFLDGSFCGVSI